MMASLARRIVSAILLIGGFLLTLYVLPSAVGVCILVGLSVLGLAEFYGILKQAGIPAFNVLGPAAGATLLAASYVSLNSGALGLGSQPVWGDVPWMVLTAVVLMVCVRQFPQKNNPQPLPTIACTMMGIMYVPFLLLFVLFLAFRWEPVSWSAPVGATARCLVLYLIVVVKASDVGAYFVGSTLGRHKMFPRISPGKTWEGLAGGLATGLLSSVAFFWFCRQPGAGVVSLGALKIGAGHAWALGACLAAIGVVGDLVESLLKRSAGLKDSGRLLPGMGGILDVLDSLLFASPVLYFYLRCAAAHP